MAILHFDVCIVGNELAGFMAGALLAQKGYRVALFNSNPNADTKKLAGLPVPWCPSVISPPIGPFDDIIERLELRTEMKNSFSKKLPFGICKDPEFRLIMPQFGSMAQKEIARAFPDEHALICAALATFNIEKHGGRFSEAIIDLTTPRWSLKNLNRRIFQTRKLPEKVSSLEQLATTSLAPYLNSMGSVFHDSYEFDQEMSLFFGANLLVHGLLIPQNSSQPAASILKKLLMESFIRHNGRLISDPITEIAAKHKAVTLIYTQTKQIYYPKVVIDATNNNDFSQYLSESLLKQLYGAEEGATQINSSAAILRKLIPIKHIPFFYPRISQVLIQNPKVSQVFALEILSTPNPDLAAVLLSGPQNSKGDNEAEMESILCSVMSFAANSCLDSDFIQGADASIHLRKWPSYRQGATSLRTVFTCGTNIFRVGKDILPTFGIEGEAVSAVAAEDLSIKLLNKKRLFYLTAR